MEAEVQALTKKQREVDEEAQKLEQTAEATQVKFNEASTMADESERWAQ